MERTGPDSPSDSTVLDFPEKISLVVSYHSITSLKWFSLLLGSISAESFDWLADGGLSYKSRSREMFAGGLRLSKGFSVDRCMHFRGIIGIGKLEIV